MTKKDYETIAVVLNACYEAQAIGQLELECLVNVFSIRLSLDNPKFDRARFTEACGIKKETTTL